MSLELSHSTPPVEVKTWGLDDTISLGEYEITLADFCEAAYYVLTNTDLMGDDDPRLAFLDAVGRLQQVDGFEVRGPRSDGAVLGKRLAF